MDCFYDVFMNFLRHQSFGGIDLEEQYLSGFIKNMNNEGQ